MRSRSALALLRVDENGSSPTLACEDDTVHSLRYRNRRLVKELASARRITSELEIAGEAMVRLTAERVERVERAGDEKLALVRRDLERLSVLSELRRRVRGGTGNGVNASHQTHTDSRFDAAIAEALADMRVSLGGVSEPDFSAASAASCDALVSSARAQQKQQRLQRSSVEKETTNTQLYDDPRVAVAVLRLKNKKNKKRDLATGTLVEIVADLRAANAALRRDVVDAHAALQLIPRYKAAVGKARNRIVELSAELGARKREAVCLRERIEELEALAPEAARRQGALEQLG